MIWLLSNIWWLVPVGIGALAIANPLFVRAVPVKVWMGLGAACLLALSFQSGRWYERTAHKAAHAVLEDKADERAAKVTERAHARAEAVRRDVRQDTKESTDEATRIVSGLPAGCPAQPERLRELGQQAVERARAEVLSDP